MLNDPSHVASHERLTLITEVCRNLQGWEATNGGTGVLRTSIVIFPAGKGSRLILDADGNGGEIRVQFRDPRGQVIPGFSFDDCVPVTTGGRSISVDWYLAGGKEGLEKGLIDLGRLDRQSVSIEFRLRNARLFGFAVEPDQELLLRLGDGPHLFIDDYLIAQAENLTRVTHHPVRLPAPAVSKDQHPAGKVAGGSLSYDPERKIFRMWPWAPGPEGIRTSLIYRESQNGLHWHGQGTPVFSFNGFGTHVMDEGPECPDPERRFKLGYFVIDPPPGQGLGMYVAFSPDGIHWTPYEHNPVLPYYPIGDPRWSQGVGDIIDPFWNPMRKRYGCFVKLMSASDKEFGLQSRTVREGLGIRLTGQTESLDFIHWEQPWRVFVPDRIDEGVTEFYGATVLARGDLLIAFTRILRDDLPAEPGGAVEGIGYTVLATSRDGIYWQRFREPFLDRNPQPGTYDRVFAWVTGVVQVGDYVYLSYAAYNQGHKTGDRQSGMARILRDRFVSREARGTQPGRLLTPLLQYRGRQPLELRLNAETDGGEIRVQVHDSEGNVIPGFSFEECEPVTGDGLSQQVRWKRPLNDLKGKAFRLEFSLRNARLYGFSFSREP